VVYVLLVACIWSVVGALGVFFLRANISLRKRLGLTFATSVLFGIVGWVDVSSIYHTTRSDPGLMAKQSVGPGFALGSAADHPLR